MNLAYRKTGTGNAWAGHNNVIDWVSELEYTIILLPDTIFGLTLPTGSESMAHRHWCERDRKINHCNYSGRKNKLNMSWLKSHMGICQTNCQTEVSHVNADAEITYLLNFPWTIHLCYHEEHFECLPNEIPMLNITLNAQWIFKCSQVNNLRIRVTQYTYYVCINIANVKSETTEY